MSPPPPPDVPSRPATADELPRNAERLLNRSHGLGLRATATYAKGTDINGALIASVVVRVNGDGFAGCASWHDRGKGFAYETGYVWRDKAMPVRVGYRPMVMLLETLCAPNADDDV